jgi:hypothetical protein
MVRSFWIAQVTLEPWGPEFEILHRKVVPIGELFAHLIIEGGYLPIIRQALNEAGFR